MNPLDTGPPRLTCHRCGATDLTLTEVMEECCQWQDGLVLVDGRIEALGEATFSPGEILTKQTRVHCWSCGHKWRPRRTFNGAYDPDLRGLRDLSS